MAKLTDNDTKFLNTLLADYATLDNLSDVQRVIIALNAKEKKTKEDYTSLRSLLKTEKDRIDNQKLIANILAQQEKLKSDAQTKFTNDIFSAVEGRKFVTGLVDTMSIKQLLQKLLDDKIVSNNSDLQQYLKTALDVELPKPVDDENKLSDEVVGDEVSPDVDVVEVVGDEVIQADNDTDKSDDEIVDSVPAVADDEILPTDDNDKSDDENNAVVVDEIPPKVNADDYIKKNSYKGSHKRF